MMMTIDTNQQRFPLNLDSMSSYSPQTPQFTNPWASSPAPSNAQNASKSLYMTSQTLHPSPLGLDTLKHDQQSPSQQQLPLPMPHLMPQNRQQPQHQHQQHQQHQQPHHQQPHHQQTQPSHLPHQHQQHHQQPLPVLQPQPQTQPQQPQQQQQQAQQQQPHQSQQSPPHHPVPHQMQHRLGSASGTVMNPYGAVPVASAPGVAGSTHRASVPESVYVGQRDMMSLPQDILSLSRIAPQQPSTSAPYDTSSYSAPSPVHPAYATSATPYEQMGYAPAPMRSTFALPTESDSRRYSHPQTTMHNDNRRSFADAIEASHGIVSLSQDTPRPMYGVRSRGSGDSYGFPSTSSSVSSTSFSGFYTGGSVDSSVSDYSTAGSDLEAMTSRALPIPRPQGYVTAPRQIPPPAQSMMSQFSSKMTSTAQKKHKCKVCDKRFTRPSSLQTHMYSHTGEKPFCCEVEGCGRHFSVVSNLRRHRKVHKDHALSETGSEEHQSE